MANLQLKRDLTAKENKQLREEFTKRLGLRLKEVRKTKKLTQQELAEKAGLHLTYISHIELGKYHPTVFVIWKVAKALGISINELSNL